MRDAIAATAAFILCAAVAYGLRPEPHGTPGRPPSAEEAPPPEIEPPLQLEVNPAPSTGLEATLDRLPAPQRDPARAPIRGRVTMDSGGEPVAGARIEAWIGAFPTPGTSLQERVRAWAEEARSSREGRIAAMTDASGWYELGGLVHADYRLEATHPDLWIVPVGGSGDAHRPGDEVDFAARRGKPFDLEIDVVGPGAGSPAEAVVTTDSPGDLGFFPAPVISVGMTGRPDAMPWSGGFRWSPSNRRIRVDRDAVLVANGPDGSISDGVAVSMSTPVERIALRLRERLGLSVGVHRPDGSEKVASRTAVMLIDPARPPSVERFARGAKWLGGAFVEGIGDARSHRPVIADIPPGTYMVGVTMDHPQRQEEYSWSRRGEPARGGRVDGWTTVEVSRGIALARIEIPEPSAEGACIAWIVGPDGRLLDGVDLVLRHDGGKRPSPRQLSIDWDRRADGTYLVIPRDDDAAGLLAGAEPGSLEIVAKHARLGEARGAVRPGSAPVAEVSFQEPGRLEVAMSGSDDGQLTLRVQTELSAAGAAATRRERPGRASIEGMRITYDRIAPGDYEARVTFACGGGATLDLYSGAISIASGETARLEVRIPEVHPVELGPGAGGVRRGELVVRGEGIRLQIGFRRGVILYLPPGAYEVVPRDPRSGTEGAPLLKFHVPETKAIEIPREEER